MDDEHWHRECDTMYLPLAHMREAVKANRKAYDVDGAIKLRGELLLAGKTVSLQCGCDFHEMIRWW